MLKKRDLSKQFELVVQQEIKEHNNAVLASNKAVNKLRGQLDSIHLIMDKNQSILENKNLSASIEINNNLIHISNELKALKSYVSDTKKELSDSTDKVKASLDKDISNKVKLSCVNKIKIDLEKSIESLKTSLVSYRNESLSQSKEVKSYCDECKVALQQETLDLKEDMTLFKDNLLEEIKASVIDKKGLTREIAVLKKAVFINEKKIENLYTLIDRVKNKPKKG